MEAQQYHVSIQEFHVGFATWRSKEDCPVNVRILGCHYTPHNDADIYIHFAPFGPQGNLNYAQTSSVVSGGLFVSGHVSIAFNGDFDWMAGSLFAHEIGHSMGLARRSLSYVAYTPNCNAFHLLHPTM